MEFIGDFLQMICESKELESHLLKERRGCIKDAGSSKQSPYTLGIAL